MNLLILLKMDDKKILLICGHPYYEKDSFLNKAIIEDLKKKLPKAEYDILIENYPEQKFDVQKEQNKLLQAEIIIFQYPIFWYSWPSLLQKYVEEIFTHGFAFGSKGSQLKGKKLILSFTAEYGEKDFQKNGAGKFTIEEIFLPSIIDICDFSELKLEGYIFTGDIGHELRKKEDEIKKLAENHADRLIKKIKELK